ncbi:hypothetical protein LCGC14_2063130 [marine sediment metagenome]|uniref:Uncharacterized protein n=1 Tax=marine sediment metagenome TaxID=412755 RepID=A0A0F9EKG1_9ZZZZ
MPEEPRKKEPLKNYVYEYRHINHVVDPLTVSNEEEWRESIRQHYRDIDSGKYKKAGKKDNFGDLRPDYAEFRKMADLAVKDARAGTNAENELLRSELEELKNLVNDLVIKLSGKDDAPPKEGPPPAPGSHAPWLDKIEPETKNTVGAGECPICKKKFKRLDMHVCKEAA